MVGSEVLSLIYLIFFFNEKFTEIKGCVCTNFNNLISYNLLYSYSELRSLGIL